jgi:hypothetical protein
MLLDKAAAVNAVLVAMAHPQGFLLAYCVLQVSIIQQQACKLVLHALQELLSMQRVKPSNVAAVCPALISPHRIKPAV